jgi:uncharacterized protein YndB with AHSA1/START domain
MSEEAKSIVVDYELDQPPEKVWRALTEPALLAAWLMSNDIRAEVGHKFTFRAPPVQGWDGVVYCEVLAVDAPRLLRYSWLGGKEEMTGYGRRLETIVTWTLTPTKNGGTLLHLEHAGFLPKDAFAFDAMGKGWRSNERIKRIVAAL